MMLKKAITYFKTHRERKYRYESLREIRQERDYDIGKLQFANRPYSRPTLSPNGTREILTTRRFIEKYGMILNEKHNGEINKPIPGEREIVDGIHYGGLPKGTIVIQKEDHIDKMVEKEMRQLQELMKNKG